MILEHGESYGSMMDALQQQEEEEKKDEHDVDNNDTTTLGTPSGRNQHLHSLMQQQATPRHEAKSPTNKTRNSNSNNERHDTITKKSSSATPPPPPTPFFIMDWLEEVNPEDLELARKLLQTPNRNQQHQLLHHHASTGDLPVCSKQEEDDEDNDTVPKDLFATATPPRPHRSASAGQLGPRSTATTPPRTPSSSTATPSRSTTKSLFHRRSVMIGNGWNAKGLHRAQQGRWKEALACWNNALEIRRQVLGEEHVDVANTQNNIGIALGKLNRPERAIQALHLALEIRILRMHQQQKEDVDDTDSTEQQQQQQHHVQQVAATLHNLANVYQQAGDLKTAIAYLQESIALLTMTTTTQPGPPQMDDGDDTEQEQPQQHCVHVARAHVAIGHVYYEAQQLEMAQQSYQQGLDILLQCSSSSSGDNGHVDPYREAEIESIRADLCEVQELLLYHKSSSKEDDTAGEGDAQDYSYDDDEDDDNDDQEGKENDE